MCIVNTIYRQKQTVSLIFFDRDVDNADIYCIMIFMVEMESITGLTGSVTKERKMRIERAKMILARVETEMAKWVEAIKNAKTQEDKEMFYGLYRVQSNAARRIEEALDRAM